MGLKVSGALALLLIFSGIYFKMYYDRTQAQLDKLRADIVTLEENEKLLKKEIAEQNEAIQEQIRKAQEAYDQINLLNERNQQATTEINVLRQKFAKHDLNYLSLRKPGLIEKIVNKGTADVLSKLEDLTSH